MPSVSGASDRHPKTDRCPTILEILIEQLRRLVIARLSFQPSDVLSHAVVDVCFHPKIRVQSSFNIDEQLSPDRGPLLQMAFRCRLSALETCRPVTTSNRIPLLSP